MDSTLVLLMLLYATSYYFMLQRICVAGLVN